LDDATYDLGDGDESASKPGRPGLPIEPRRVLWILSENRKSLFKVFAVVAALAFIFSFFLPRTYESSAQLLFEGTPELEREGAEPTPGAFIDAAIAPSRLREVRDQLGWDISLDKLASKIEVSLEGKAAMRIVGRERSAERAHALARSVLDVFLARQASFNKGKLERLTSENAQALEHAKKRRDEAIARYDEFRKKSGRPDVIQEQAQLMQRAAGLRSKADEAAVEIAAQQARIAELEKAQADLPKQIVASATKGSPVDSPLAQARSELAAARSSLSEEHPRVQALKQRVASLQAQRKGAKSEIGGKTLAANPARAAVEQQLATARAALAGATEREAALRVLIKSTQAEAEALAPGEGEARKVLGELRVADERLDELTERGAKLRDAGLRPLTGFRVMSSPMLPESSSRSKAHLMLLGLLPVLAALIMALFIIARRLRTLEVEAPREVAWWGNGPVLGTSVWPRDPNALETFVDELEDYGVYGAGRTLVVPATEAERDIACSFAMRLADAPWLAAAILDVGDRAGQDARPLVTPKPEPRPPRLTPPSVAPPRRLSSDASPSVRPGGVIKTPTGRPAPRHTMQGFFPPTGGSVSPPPVVTPPPEAESRPPVKGYSSRPPRKKTVIGLPAVGAHGSPPTSSPPPAIGSARPMPSTPPSQASRGPEPFQRKRRARATVRMMVPVTNANLSAIASTEQNREEDAFLLTRPVPVAREDTPPKVGRAVHVASESPRAGASNAVMRAAVRLLGNEEGLTTQARRSAPPGPRGGEPAAGSEDVTGVALAWNGPLSGPVLRRAARLAHRVIVVVSSGLSVIDLARVQTRLGRHAGVGYVLVNVGDAYVDLEDRVGPVETFWERDGDAEGGESRRP
jgi:uncharacterized protein involved in exopolysaccharide biosynthesis